MAVVTDWGQAFLTAISNAFSKFFGFLPDLIGALLILFIGWYIAGILSKLVANILRKIRFNEATDKAGLSRFIQSAGVRKDASSIMGEIVKWFFRLIALVAAFSVLQLPALTAALTGILNFIPNLFVALVIILVGSLIANFVADFVKGAASSAGFSNAGLVSNVARYAILYVAVIAALGQIGIAATVINTIFIGTIAALALAIGLAFGLGGRDTASKIWESTYNSAQQNLPKLGSGMKQQAQQQQRQQMPQVGAQVYNQPQPQPRQVSNAGYQAGYTTNTPPANQPGVYNAPPANQPGGYYNQPSQGNGGYYGGNPESGQGRGQGQPGQQGGSYSNPSQQPDGDYYDQGKGGSNYPPRS